MTLIKRIITIIFIVLVGVGGAAALILTRPKVDRVQPGNPAPFVRVLLAHKTRHQVNVKAWGTVIPAERIVLVPQVLGCIVKQNKNFVPGGRFRKGEVMLNIDPRDYENAVEQAKTALEQAKFALSVEKGRQIVAKKEWELLASEFKGDEASRSLALREPHLTNAKAVVRGAESALRQARLDLARTTLHAPYNALVQAESVDLGQLVSLRSRLATLVGTDRYWVQVAVPADLLHTISVPGVNAPTGAGAAVEVVRETRNQRYVWSGKVVRLLADIERAGRMSRVLVAIEDPLGLKKPERERHPLLIGTYVQATIAAQPLASAVAVSRRAYQDGDRVFILKDLPSPPTFARSDSFAWETLVTEIKSELKKKTAASDPALKKTPLALLVSKLPISLREKIKAFPPERKLPEEIIAGLFKVLTTLLKEADLLKLATWDKATMPPFTQKLLARFETGKLPPAEKLKLNRLLLGHAFPNALPSWPRYQLDIRKVRTSWRFRDDVLIENGIADGERIITSRIALPVPGQRLSWDGFTEAESAKDKANANAANTHTVTIDNGSASNRETTATRESAK